MLLPNTWGRASGAVGWAAAAGGKPPEASGELTGASGPRNRLNKADGAVDVDGVADGAVETSGAKNAPAPPPDDDPLP
jgi:hypothetical protein